MNKTRAFLRIVLAIWVFLWALFLIRPFFKKGLWKEYSSLLKLPLDGKRAFIIGEELYGFIGFCVDSIEPPSSYRIIGLEKEDPLVYRRAVYYLYPNIDSPEAEYLIVYKTPGFAEKGYYLFKKMSPDKFILKRLVK